MQMSNQINSSDKRLFQFYFVFLFGGCIFICLMNGFSRDSVCFYFIKQQNAENRKLTEIREMKWESGNNIKTTEHAHRTHSIALIHKTLKLNSLILLGMLKIRCDQPQTRNNIPNQISVDSFFTLYGN